MKSTTFVYFAGIAFSIYIFNLYIFKINFFTFLDVCNNFQVFNMTKSIKLTT